MGAGSPFGPILERWNQLPRARQIALGGIVAGIVVVAYFVFSASSQPNMVTAYNNLDAEDAASIASQLETDGTAYELGGGGTSISVPANKVAAVRIKLAAAGLPKGGSVGLEIFDKTNFGATDFVQKVNFMRGLEGELSRSINTLNGVKASRVHIVLPQESIFKQDQAATTASVLVSMRAGTSLGQDQVRGITNLVTNSVEGLKQAGVTIIDDGGHVLFDGATADNPFSGAASTTQLQAQHAYEAALANDVQSTLSKVVGTGRSAVTVRAMLNFDNVKETKDAYGSQPQVRSQTTTNETYTGSGTGINNVPGTGTNGGTNTGTTTGNGNSNYNRTDTTTNNELDKTTTTTVKAPGSLQKLSVSVVLDDSVTAAQEASLTSTVAAAVGLDQTRGDTLSVTRLPFDASVKSDLVPAVDSGLGQYLQYLKLLLPLLAVILGFVLVMLLLRSLGKRQQLALPASMPMQALPAAGMVPAIAAPRVQLGALEPASDPHEDRVMKLAEVNPRAVADVVQTWMREEDQ